MMIKIKNSLLITVSILFIFLFAINAKHYMVVFTEGVTMWAINVLPSLLPFALLSKLLLSNATQNTQSTPPNKLFALSKQHISTLLLSLLCGYPIGAKLASQLPQNNSVQRKQKSMAVAFCSTAGPMFLIATIGASFLSNTTATIIIIVSTISGTAINALLYCNTLCPLNTDTTEIQSKNFPAMLDSLLTVFCVGGYIAVFYLIADMIRTSFAGLPFAEFVNIVTGLLEMTGGCYYIAKNFSLEIATILCSALTAFGGLCILMQNITFLRQCGYTLSKVTLMKTTQCLITGLIAYLLTLLLM